MDPLSSSLWTDDIQQAIRLEKEGNYDLALRLFDKVGPLPHLPSSSSFSSFADLVSFFVFERSRSQSLKDPPT